MELTDFEKSLKDGEFIGIVENNIDPDKKQRLKIRIPYLHGDKIHIPTDSLSWTQPKRDNNGLSFQIPDVGKVVNVTFPTGNLYYSVYDNAQHLNINLQKKVEEYSGDDYTAFVALCYNHNTQIFIDNQKGLNIIHKFNGINIAKDQIAVNLKDNQSTLYLGDDKAAQELMLGTHYMEWMDTLMQALMDPYIGNSGAPVVANPTMINVINQYQAKRSTFLSQHIYAIDNNKIRSKDFDIIAQIGDKIEQTNKNKELSVTTQPIDYKPEPKTEEKGLSELNEYTPPVNDKTDAPEKSIKQSSTDNIKLDKMIKYLQSQKYEVYSDPYHVNIIGIRNAVKDSGTVTNKFDDTCWVFFKDDKDQWQLYDDYKVTTTPGFEPNSSSLPSGPNNGGVAMLVYGQFKDRWKLGYHQNRTGKQGGKTKKDGSIAPEHKALVQASTAHIRNTPSGTGYLIPGEKNPSVGSIGINIHHSSETGVSTNVYNYSEGCQVFASKNQHLEFIGFCQQQIDKAHKGTFTYTLIPQKEFDNYNG